MHIYTHMYACMQEQACIQSLHTVLALARSASGSSCVYSCNKGSLLPASCVHIKVSNKRCTLCHHCSGHAVRRSRYERINCSTRAILLSSEQPDSSATRKSCKKIDQTISPHKLQGWWYFGSYSKLISILLFQF